MTPTLVATLADLDEPGGLGSPGAVSVDIALSTSLPAGTVLVLAYFGHIDFQGLTIREPSVVDQNGNSLSSDNPYATGSVTTTGRVFAGFRSARLTRPLVGPLSTTWTGTALATHVAVYAFSPDVTGGGGHGQVGDDDYMDEIAVGNVAPWGPFGNAAFGVAVAHMESFSTAPLSAAGTVTWGAGWTELQSLISSSFNVPFGFSFAYRLGSVVGELVTADFGPYDTSRTKPSANVGGTALFLTDRRQRVDAALYFGELVNGRPTTRPTGNVAAGAALGGIRWRRP